MVIPVQPRAPSNQSPRKTYRGHPRQVKIFPGATRIEAFCTKATESDRESAVGTVETVADGGTAAAAHYQAPGVDAVEACLVPKIPASDEPVEASPVSAGGYFCLLWGRRNVAKPEHIVSPRYCSRNKDFPICRPATL